MQPCIITQRLDVPPGNDQSQQVFLQGRGFEDEEAAQGDTTLRPKGLKHTSSTDLSELHKNKPDSEFQENYGGFTHIRRVRVSDYGEVSQILQVAH